MIGSDQDRSHFWLETVANRVLHRVRSGESEAANLVGESHVLDDIDSSDGDENIADDIAAADAT